MVKKTLNLLDETEKEKLVLDIFNSAVHKYDLMNTLMTLGLDRSWRKSVVRYSAITAGGTGLDVCCGTGKLTLELACQVGPAGRVVGLDFCEKMLNRARKRVIENNMQQNVELVTGNALDLPFGEDTFDCAAAAWGLRNVSDLSRAVREMLRVIKPGGRVLSLDMARPTLPFFKDIYWPFFKVIIPAVSTVFSAYKKAYEYLYESAELFVNQQQLAEIFRETGLTEVNYHNLCGGVVAIVEGRKA